MNKPNSIEKIILPRWYSKISLGDYSYINDAADIHSFRSPQTIVVGKYCSIGACTFLVDGDHNITYASTYPFREFDQSKNAPMNANIKNAPVINHDVWICDNSVIIGGVTIGNGAVIAAHSVVTKDIPPYAVVAGNPAKIVKYRFDEHTISRLEHLQWWHLSHKVICEELAPCMDNLSKFIEILERIRESEKFWSNST